MTGLQIGNRNCAICAYLGGDVQGKEEKQPDDWSEWVSAYVNLVTKTTPEHPSKAKKIQNK